MFGSIAWILLKGLPSLAGVTGLPAGRAAGYVFLAAVLVLAVASRMWYGIPRSWHGFGVLTILFVIVLWAHVGAWGAADARAMTGLNLRALFLALTLTALVVRRATATLLLALLTASIALVQVVSLGLSVAILIPGLARLSSPDRLAGVFAGSFTLGYAATAAVGGLGIAYHHVRSRTLRVVVLVGIVAALVNSFLAVNRTSVIAILALFVGWLIERARFGGRASIGTAVAGACMAAAGTLLAAAVFGLVAWQLAPEAVAGYVDTWRFRLAALGNVGGQSIRWLTIDAGLRMFEAHPLVGVGWDNVARFSVRFGATFDSTAHNAFVQGLAEGGVFGFAYALGLLVVVPGTLWWRHRGVAGSWVFAGAWAAVVAFNLIASNLHLEGHWDVLFLWMLATRASGPAMELTRGHHADPERSTSGGRAPTATASP